MAIILACPMAPSAKPYSIKTFGFAVNAPLFPEAVEVTSATNAPAFSIFRKIVSKIGGDPGTPCVSLSTAMFSRRASSTVRSARSRLTASRRALSMKIVLPLPEYHSAKNRRPRTLFISCDHSRTLGHSPAPHEWKLDCVRHLACRDAPAVWQESQTHSLSARIGNGMSALRLESHNLVVD